MANPFRKLPLGSSVTAFSITAWNRMIDMLNWWVSNQGHSGGGPLRNLVDWDQSVFKTKNSSGADVSVYGPLGLSGPRFGPTDNLTEFRNVTPLEGVEPTVEDHAGGKWGVLLETTANGSYGRCCFSGVVPVRVYVNGADDQFCDVIDAETVGSETCYLGTGGSGAQILWRENAGSGEGTIVWALVRLGSSSATVGSEVYQLFSHMDQYYTALANPGHWDSVNGIWKLADEDKDEYGVPKITANTRVILDTTRQQCGWSYDWVRVGATPPVLSDAFVDPNEAILTLLSNAGVEPSYLEMTQRMSQQLTFYGVIDDEDGLETGGGAANANLYINGYTYSDVPVFDDGMLGVGQKIPDTTPILVRFDPRTTEAARKYYVIAAPCNSVS